MAVISEKLWNGNFITSVMEAVWLMVLEFGFGFGMIKAIYDANF